MKKAVFLLVFMTLAVSSFAFEFPNRNLFIEGTAESSAHRTFFMNNFRMEASALGFTVVDNKADAAYTFRFEDQKYDDDWDPSIKFIILISLFLNDGDRELVSFGWPYAELDDMYEYNQFVFFKAAVLIPGISEDDFTGLTVDDTRWKNKWLYLRASFDFPITFNVLKVDKDRLIDGIGVYEGEFEKPNRVSPLDHKIYALPGATVGIEVQPLSFISVEGNFQISFGDTRDNMFLNMAVGAQLKFPIKLSKHYMIEPYGAFLYPLNFSEEVFEEFPEYFFGGGVQFGVKGGKSGVFFVDVNYMMALTDAVMKNNFGELYPEPPTINYKRFAIGLGIGYKFGLFDRK